MDTKTPLRFSEKRSREECDLATLVGLCLAKRVLSVVPSGGIPWGLQSALDIAIKNYSYDEQTLGYKLASRVELPALSDQTRDMPLDSWSDAIWNVVLDESRPAVELDRSSTGPASLEDSWSGGLPQ
jgi:hypothetical protein